MLVIWKKLGVAIDIISQATGLSKEEIEKLKGKSWISYWLRGHTVYCAFPFLLLFEIEMMRTKKGILV